MSSSRPLVTRPQAGAAVLESLAGFGELYAQLFAARGVKSAIELDYGLANLAPISSLENIDAAVELLLSKRDERIVVVGDFDVDGATSTALMLRCFREFGFKDVDYRVPNRFKYGYGLTPEIVKEVAKSSPALIITVDNGISSLDGVEEARSSGIAVLVTDHHLPGDQLPSADVIVNPNLSGSRFASANLAGVGVAFYVLAALGQALQEQGQPGAARIPATYLDLVALGTVADVVPLDHNNRILVEQGIRRMRAGKTVPGISALLQQGGRQVRRTVSSDLGFAVGPRLNAAGRLEDMSLGIECLLTDDHDVAARHAATLDQINKQRREIESTMRDQAFSYVESLDPRRLPRCVCLYEASWHQGVVGLIASRVKDRCHRPVIAFAKENDGFLKGSGRSVSGVNIRDLLESISTVRPGLIDKFGGHAMAAGLTIAESAYEEFARLADAQLARLYPDADFSGAILTDGPLPSDAMTLTFARDLRDAGPWGSGFPEPMWSGDFEVVEQRTVGEKHLKLRVCPVAGGTPVDAIAFNQAGPVYRGVVQLAYRLDVNEYRGVERAQLIVEQISPV
ncbi:MAG: single-stranded-DNA-specific exonuclease RecJ [Proteobacteria bacterium]|nr:single-stranded-DNA-specific exonuclease RecJ [Pseudomonadota bacterium]